MKIDQKKNWQLYRYGSLLRTFAFEEMLQKKASQDSPLINDKILPDGENTIKNNRMWLNLKNKLGINSEV